MAPFPPFGPDLYFAALSAQLQSAPGTLLFSFFTFFGTPFPWLALALYLFLKKERREAIFLSGLVLGSLLLTEGLKAFFQRPRPSQEDLSYLPGFLQSLFSSPYSFPSGHALLAGAVYAYFFPRLTHAQALLGGLGLGLVAFSRIYLDVHYFSDVAAGLALGFLLGGLLVWGKSRSPSLLKTTKE